MSIDQSMNGSPSSQSSPSRQELEARIATLEKQRAELIAERETLLAEVQHQSQWLQRSWRKLESERRHTSAQSQPQPRPAISNTNPDPSPVQPVNQQPAQQPNRNAIQQFQKLQKGVRR